MNTKTCLRVLMMTLVLFLFSCKKILDVNDDETRTSAASIDLVLPSAIGFTAYQLGSPLQLIGGIWGQYWTQGPTANQYNAYEQYVLNSDDFDRPWLSLYEDALSDMKYLSDEGIRTGRENYAAIGKILQAYVFQYITDLYGDIPFSEALDPNNPTPVFDSQESVYDGLIVLVDEGLALLDENSSDHPGDDDILYGGDMTLWKKFANTLKLRIYLRQAYVRPAVAEAGIAAMYASGASFLETGEDAVVQFTTGTFNQHPLYMTQETLSTDNLIASNTVIDYLIENNDPRIEFFYIEATVAPNAGSYAGLDQGIGKDLTGILDGNMWSKPGPMVGGPSGEGDAPLVLMSAAESYFLQAEAAGRGWGDDDAATLYESGIKASFQYWGLSASDAADYYGQSAIAFPDGGSLEEKLDAIITQKWVSMNGNQNLEAWTEWRRTGYPDMLHISAATNIGDVFPVRVLYTETEISRNPNTPPQTDVTDKVWWDVNTTGQN